MANHVNYGLCGQPWQLLSTMVPIVNNDQPSNHGKPRITDVNHRQQRSTIIKQDQSWQLWSTIVKHSQSLVNLANHGQCSSTILNHSQPWSRNPSHSHRPSTNTITLINAVDICQLTNFPPFLCQLVYENDVDGHISTTLGVVTNKPTSQLSQTKRINISFWWTIHIITMSYYTINITKWLCK